MFSKQIKSFSLIALALLLSVFLLGVGVALAGQVTKTFRVSGSTTGVGWSWGIVIHESLVGSDKEIGPVVPVAGVPDCQQFVDLFINTINGKFPSGRCVAKLAGAGGPPPFCEFTITCDEDFQFLVGDAAGTQASGCEVTNNPGGCQFNPLITERQVVYLPIILK